MGTKKKALKVFAYAASSIVGLILFYLALVIFSPGFSVPAQPIEPKPLHRPSDASPPEARWDVEFKVEGTTLRGWLYLPDSLSIPAPCVVMNNGFGGTKDMVLAPFAERFRDAGFAVLSFDYRCFGESDGEPRQLFSVNRQLADCRAAIEYARDRPEIDPDRIAIWGTSAGAGYGLILAGDDRRIACVCAQAAGFDTDEAGRAIVEREGMGFVLRLIMHAQRDKGRSRFGLSAHRIPIAGRPGTLAFLNGPGAFDGYSALGGPGFVNEVCARALLETGVPNAMEAAEAVRCPVLIQVGERDRLVPGGSAGRVAETLGGLANLKHYPCGHFDFYRGEFFERSVSDQIVFLRDHMVVKAAQ